jgi:hypothetical protein
MPFSNNTDAQSNENLFYEVKASNGRLNRKVTGPVTAEVDGVPAEPVHAFVWDGDGSEPIEGNAQLRIDPVGNAGVIKAEWTDRNGHWKLRQTVFAPPVHPTGLRLGSVASAGMMENLLIEGDPVTNNVYLHGDTTAGEPVLPTLFNLLATWGPGELTLNGKPFENPFTEDNGPEPLWAVHTMTTAGVRNDAGEVRMADGSIYNPTKRGEVAAIDYDDLELHIVFHDLPGPEITNNFPPPVSFFYHIMFEDVQVQIKHGE